MSIYEIAEEEREFALSTLLHVGALTTCIIHEDVIYEGSGDVEAAYRYANKVFSNNQKSLTFSDRREMTDMIKIIFEEYCGCDICPSCDG
ncbi:hypothetical protein U3A98_001487 [Cronobacter turicensis]|nr:hypothetical protein [Cronobacter turicensis]